MENWHPCSTHACLTLGEQMLGISNWSCLTEDVGEQCQANGANDCEERDC